MRFRDLSIGQKFDFVDDANFPRNTFYATCTKVSPRCYTYVSHRLATPRTLKCQVGTINCTVYHPECPRCGRPAQAVAYDRNNRLSCILCAEV